MDMSATVGEVIGSDTVIRIAGRSPLHYLVADRSGRVAAVEFLDGHMTTHAGATLPVAVLTNDTYEESLAFLTRTREAGRPSPEGVQSLPRFARTAERVAAYRKMEPDQSVAHAFTTLGAASNETTQWSIVYDPGQRHIHFKTRRQPAVKSLNLAALDFACASPVMMLDINAKGRGDVTNALLPWSVEANLGLVRGAYARTSFLSDVSETEIQLAGRAPLAATCDQVNGKGDIP